MLVIKLLRQNKRITAVDAAKQMGIPHATYAPLEDGRIGIPKMHYETLEKYFRYSIDELKKEVKVEILDQAIATAISKM